MIFREMMIIQPKMRIATIFFFLSKIQSFFFTLRYLTDFWLL